MQVRLKTVITTLIFTGYIVAFSAIGIYRFNLGQVFYYDFGIFAHIIWQLSRFQIPVINHLVLGKIIFLGDHFEPGLVLFAPLFWITKDLRILLIEQSIALVSAGGVIFLISQKLHLRYLTSIALASTYLLFAGSENPLVTDWHPELTAAFFLLLFFYLYQFSSKNLLMVCAFLGFLSLKESNAITMCMMLIFIFTVNKNRRHSTAGLFIFSAIYFIFAVKVAIPFLAHRPYLYTPDLPYSPVKIAQNFVNRGEKIKLINDSLISFGYVPVLSGVGLIPVFAELAFRLAPNTTIFNNLTLGQHYNVLLGVFLGLGSIYGIKRVGQWTKNNQTLQLILSIYMLLMALYVARKITGSPINLVINKTFWKELQPRDALFSDFRKIPEKGSVMSQNNLLAYTANRNDELYLIGANYEYIKPKVIFFDLTENQNINNFYGSDRKIVEEVQKKLSTDQKYHQLDSRNKNIYIYVRN